MHDGNDVTVYGIDPKPNEIKEKVVGFLRSEVSSTLKRFVYITGVDKQRSGHFSWYLSPVSSL